MGATEYSSAAVDTPCVYVPALGEAQSRKSIWEDPNGASCESMRCSCLASTSTARIAQHCIQIWHATTLQNTCTSTRHQPRHRAPPAGTALINSGLGSANHLLKRVPVVARWIFMDSAQWQLLMSLCWRAAQPTETNNIIA